MSRYVGSVCRLCRREGEKLFLKGLRCYSDKCAIERRPYPSGQHGQRRAKISDFGIQLREKQKLKRIYGLQEKPMGNLFKKAERLKGITGENLLSLLERRLDNVVYRMGLAGSRKEARQLVKHCHFKLNGSTVNVPSMIVSAGDVITTADSLKKSAKFAGVAQMYNMREVPSWLDVNKEELRATIKDLPKREDVTAQIEERLVVELYSK